MSPAPDRGAFAAELYEQLAPLNGFEEQLDYPTMRFWGTAVQVAYQPLEDLARDQGERPGYSGALDPESAPSVALPWLGQFSGTVVPPGLGAEDARRLVSTAPNLRRGTVAHLIEMVRSTLDPNTTRRVVVRERNGGPSIISVYTWLDETPDPDLTEATARYYKRAKLILDYNTISAGTYGSLAASGLTYDDVESGFTDYADLELNAP